VGRVQIRNDIRCGRAQYRTLSSEDARQLFPDPGTHVLLPDLALVRRRDEVLLIGAAIEAKVVAGEGHRPIAERLGVPEGHCARLAASIRCSG
jgi:hypothetical protein